MTTGGPIAGVRYMALAVFLWAVMETIGGSLPPAYTAFQVVWMRYATHLAFMLLVFAPRRGMRMVRTPRLGLQLARALTMLLMPLCFVGGLLLMSMDEVFGVFWTAPLLIPILSVVLLRDRLDRRSALATAAGFAGVMVILHPTGVIRLAAVLPLGMALCFSLYVVMTRILRDEPTITSLFYTASGVLVPLSVVVPLFWQPLTPAAGGTMIAIGLVGFWVLFALDRAAELAPPAILAPFCFLQPIWMLALAYAIAGTRPSRRELLGAGIAAASCAWLLLTMRVRRV